MSHHCLVSVVIVRLCVCVWCVCVCVFVLTLGHRLADPVTGWSHRVQVNIGPIDTATAVYF